MEGGDGSGKGTQTKIFVETLRAEGYDVMHLSFPQYGNVSAEIVQRYLNNEFGAALEVPAELASLAYAIDRAAAAPEICSYLEKPGGIVVTDRYVASNIAHQGTKFNNTAARQRFYNQLIAIEFTTLNLPKPDLNLVLLVPSSVAQANVALKAARSYTTATHDGHEASADHLQHANENYQELCILYPGEFFAIECMRATAARHAVPEMRTTDEIAVDIRRVVKEKLEI